MVELGLELAVSMVESMLCRGKGRRGGGEGGWRRCAGALLIGSMAQGAAGRQGRAAAMVGARPAHGGRVDISSSTWRAVKRARWGADYG
jgi:hypothetical protein